MARFVQAAFLILLVTFTIHSNLPVPLAKGSQQDFGTCNSLPQGWTCGNVHGQTGTTATITNGALETDLYAMGVGNDNDYQFATSQKGTFPWSPCQPPAPDAIPANLTTISTTFTPLTLPTIGRYHIYIALYYWLPNGPVTAGGTTYRCLDTQSDLLAWGLTPTIPCQLAGIEIGVEGFLFDTLKVQWTTVSTTALPTTKTNQPSPSFPALDYLFIGLVGSAIVGALLVVRRWKHAHPGPPKILSHRILLVRGYEQEAFS